MNLYLTARGAIDTLRDRYAPITHTSTFQTTGQITPEEFLAAGDYLVYKFPTWAWSDASSLARRVSYLPAGKQFLVTRGVPSHQRLDEHFAGAVGVGTGADDLVRDGFLGEPEGHGGEDSGAVGGVDDDDTGWLRTGGVSEREQERMRGEVRTMTESGEVEEKRSGKGKGAVMGGDGEEEDDDDDDEEIPDMEDEDDDNEAIIRDPRVGGGSSGSMRSYNLYITYTPYYRTPRFYLSGYLSASEPLAPAAMMEDIVGDYKDKTVTLEDFPFYDNSVRMVSVHPCRHASVMKVLLDRADAALKLRMQKIRQGHVAAGSPEATYKGMEGLIDDTSSLSLNRQQLQQQQQQQQRKAYAEGVKAAGGTGQGDEWEVLDQDEGEGQEEENNNKVAIRVDQYLVVFLKFMASVTPGIEHDFTMGV